MRSESNKHIKELISFSSLNNVEDGFIYFDFNSLEENLNKVRNAFPKNTRHAVALKTNPLIRVIEFIGDRNFGLECSTLNEVKITQSLNKVSPSFININSVFKTFNDLDYYNSISDSTTIFMNINSLEELEFVYDKISPNINILLRINPTISQVGFLDSMSVSNKQSKFGFSLENGVQFFKNIISKYKKINGIHVHVGSQSFDLANNIKAINSIVDLSEQLNNIGQIEYFNIGGGLPFDYKDRHEVDIQNYVNKLDKRLFENYQVITEFGRFYHANTAHLFSKIQQVNKEQNIVLIPFGANMFLRECYNPNDWYHQNKLYSPANSKGEAKNYRIGGPLCFGLDYPFNNVSLVDPSIEDWLISKDIGANTFSLWSKHCSTSFPLIVGEYNGIKGVLKTVESFDKVLNFWQ